MKSFLFRRSYLVVNIFCIFSLILISCHKEPVMRAVQFNQPFIIHATEVLDIRASDVLTTNTTIKRKIEFINRISNHIEDSFIISAESFDTSKFFLSSIRQKSFKAALKIESNNQVLYNMNFENGKVVNSGQKNTGEYKIKSNLVPTCKVNLIHGCVSNAISNMGVVEYMACLYNAPSCYSLVWAGCAFNYCVTGEQR